MEDDDEFGDLYTDVLSSFPSSSGASEQPLPPSSTTVTFSETTDLKSQIKGEEIDSEAPVSGFTSPSRDVNQALVAAAPPLSAVAGVSESRHSSGEEEDTKDLTGVSGNLSLVSPSRTGSRVPESRDDERVGGADEDPDGDENPFLDIVKDETDDAGGVHDKLDDANRQDGDIDLRVLGSEPVIPGLLIRGDSNDIENAGAEVGSVPPPTDASAEGDDWDSDSDDDLQIVLNDNSHVPMAMEVGADEYEDGDPLAMPGGDDPNHQQAEEHEWGEDAAQSADADRKDIGEAKVNGGPVSAPKIGYSSHGYHPFHSQFKYVRPGATLALGTAGAGPGAGPSQVRPLGNMGLNVGRGRGDWRPMGTKGAPPSVQKGYHPGYAMPWANSMGRGFGGGLEFTLPSHKTIFDVDIDGFEEKPWKLPGVDVSDFFNFGLNEDGWKGYCKQLEQQRLEATMQSKIRVYESGRMEQEFDPDLPPELAAAAAVHDYIPDPNCAKLDGGEGDLAKGSSRLRPPLPTGRPIQVECGSGERLPSIDTRPQRVRESDSVIEIPLQGPIDDDSSGGDDALDQPVIDSQGEIFTAVQDENAGDGDEPTQHGAASRIKTSVHGTGDLKTVKERQTKGRSLDTPSHVSSSQSSQDKGSASNENEEPVACVNGKHSPSISSPISIGDAGVHTDINKVSEQDEGNLADENSQMKMDEMTLSSVDAVKGEDLLYPVKKQKLSSRVEQPALQISEDAENMKGTRSSDTQEKSGSTSKDYPRGRDSAEEEFVQDQHFRQTTGSKRHADEDESSLRRAHQNARQEVERQRPAVKGKDDSYSNSTAYTHIRKEALDMRKERDASDGPCQKRDEDPHGRRIRSEDTRRREHNDDMRSRHRSKLQESERSDKDKHIHSRKQIDNGTWRGHRDKEVVLHHKERDDYSKTRHARAGDVHSKKRKDEEHSRRDNTDKEVFPGARESNNHRKRERDSISDHRKRDDQGRIRDNPDDLHSVRHKDDLWTQRERSDRSKERERDDWPRSKQSLHGENLSRREREEGRTGVRLRGAEDKGWVVPVRMKDDYGSSDKDFPVKDTGRNDQHTRRDRAEDESVSRVREDRGNLYTSDDRRSRQDRSGARNDRVDNRMHEKRYKDGTRTSKGPESVDHNISLRTNMSQEDLAGSVTVSSRGIRKQANSKLDIPKFSRKPREVASSDDEQQDSKRGRSKLERWTSHTERDYTINSNSVPKVKDINMNNNGGSSLASKLSHESPKAVEVDNQQSLLEEKETGLLDSNDADTKPMEDRHLDTVEKLKKRSERFKLPMPVEKDPVAIKKMEDEALPSVQSDVRADLAVKQERPARKRRWISSS